MVALALSISALVASRNPVHPYAGEIYAMTARTHRRYALIGALFAIVLLADTRFTLPIVPILGALTLVVILYLTSFLRGFSDER